MIEPSHDESRLLTDEEIDTVWLSDWEDAVSGEIKYLHQRVYIIDHAKLVAQAQDAKTASILKAQEQERVERIFKELEDKYLVNRGGFFQIEINYKPDWQALKKKEMPK